jgi:pyruvate kinase
MRTKIVATIGPASAEKNILKKMLLAGLDVCRINMSHGNYAQHKKVIQTIKQLNKELGTNVPVLGDLQGPKIRLGEVKKDTFLKKGEIINIIAEEIIGDDKTISVSLKSICQDVRKGDRILLDDGKIVLESLGVEKNKLKALVIQGGEISSRKGMNLPDSKLSVPCLSEKDIADISFLVEMQAEWIALSFVRSAADIIELRHIISNLRLEHKPYIIAKIEKPEAIEDFDNILKETDGIMVARGDLGLEIPLEKLPLTQKMIIKKTNAQSKPVIIATQMMENMIYNIYPSRAEVNDVANSVMDGADALMLSAETSVGKYPVEVIQTMQRIISQVEDFEDIYYKHHQSKIKNNSRFITDSVLYTACSLAKDSEAKAIVAMTQSGYSAFKLSAQRPKAKIFIFTNNKAIINTLNLLWGVEAFYYDKYISTDHTIEDIHYLLIKKGELKEGDMIINTASTPLQDYGKTNMLKLSCVK